MKIQNMSRRTFIKSFCMTAVACGLPVKLHASEGKPMNIVMIYADDLGYGDVSCYGATRIKTPNIDKLASEGIRFTNTHASSATCTPSRYSLLTGEYAWRRKDTGVAQGDARMIIEPGRSTLPSMLKKAGYATGVVGKWHLGLGAQGKDLDWNGEIKPGPSDIGFDYSFLIPATGDRVPCVYVENGRVVGLDPSDSIKVSFQHPVGDEPTGREHPELLKMHPSHGHDQTIINGISRIGYMSGGKTARWVDEDIADTITSRAVNFIEKHRDKPFFLYFATNDIHVPRVPHPRFAGKSGLGPRGDVILQLDWCVGKILDTLELHGIADNTIVIFTSDNGPVVDDGYRDEAVEKLNGHTPCGPLRGGKYSAFDAGTRVPFILRWPEKVKPGESDALMSQIDIFASFAAFTGQTLSDHEAPDSLDMFNSLTGKNPAGRDHLVEHARALSLIMGDWKYIEPSAGPGIDRNVNIELGNNSQPQLYNLREDIGEKNNLAGEYPEKVKQMAEALRKIRDDGRTRKSRL